jgi:hypothetical protein
MTLLAAHRGALRQRNKKAVSQLSGALRGGIAKLAILEGVLV